MTQTPRAPNGLIGTDPVAFERFYRLHVRDVERFLARRVSDVYLAADLTADVFLAAIRSTATVEEPRAWLYGIARNVIAAHFRRGEREGRTGRAIRGRELLADDDIALLEERIDAESRSRELYRAMDRLTDVERAVLELVALDGLSPREAASALGISAVTARARLSRARRRMRAHLAVTEPGHPLITTLEVSR